MVLKILHISMRHLDLSIQLSFMIIIYSSELNKNEHFDIFERCSSLIMCFFFLFLRVYVVGFYPIGPIIGDACVPTHMV